MAYAIKEIFYSLQGEGLHTGRPALFLRFSGCNLWSGREEDRTSAVCQFCDTDFFGVDGEQGGKYASASELAEKVASMWPDEKMRHKFVVCTGGEPTLQLDDALISALKEEGFQIAVETNGTTEPPANIDWLCVSPKASTNLVVSSGNELKLVYPQPDAQPELFEDLGFDHFFLQPMDGPDIERNTRLTLDYCLAHPNWRLSLQSHKLLQIQ